MSAPAAAPLAPVSPARTGVWIGIAAIVMSFAAFTSALIVRQGAGPEWQHVRLPPILFANTLVLLVSSATLERSRSRGARVETALPWLYLTLGLGLAFLGGQIAAWRSLAEQGLGLASSANSAFFYLFTAAHGLHLLGGLGGLTYALRRLQRSRDPAARHVLGTAAVYWHFMDGLWLYLLVLLVLRV